MKTLKTYNELIENVDYFKNGDIILKQLDNTLYVVYNIKKKLYLRIGLYDYKEIKWFVDDIIKLNHLSLHKLYNEMEKLVYMTIPDNIILKIKEIGNIDISEKIKRYRINNSINNFNI